MRSNNSFPHLQLQTIAWLLFLSCTGWPHQNSRLGGYLDQTPQALSRLPSSRPGSPTHSCHREQETPVGPLVQKNHNEVRRVGDCGGVGAGGGQATECGQGGRVLPFSATQVRPHLAPQSFPNGCPGLRPGCAWWVRNHIGAVVPSSSLILLLSGFGGRSGCSPEGHRN